MKATVKITKSFDDGMQFSKEWDTGDFEEFFQKEGEYLDRLSKSNLKYGVDGEGFIVTYEIEVRK